MYMQSAVYLVSEDKRQVYYDVCILLYEKKIFSKWKFDMRQAASGQFIMIIILKYWNEINSMYEFDMRHVTDHMCDKDL